MAEQSHERCVLVFPELTLSGYPPEDLLLRPSIEGRVADALQAVCKGVGHSHVVVGYPRLQGGKLNKARKGELRRPLPVGFCYDEEGRTMFDPDEEVRGAVRLLFDAFRKTGSAFAVVHHFALPGIGCSSCVL